MKKPLLLATILSFLHLPLGGQTPGDTTEIKALDSVVVVAGRIDVSLEKAPYSISSIPKELIQANQLTLSPDIALQYLPGVFVSNAENFAQDVRISIRGFGARAAFGIRGIRLMVDGLPESTPDGTAQVDNLDMGAVQRMEVIRGPNSALYGNAAGGILYIETDEANAGSMLRAGITTGSFGLQKYQLQGGFTAGKWSGILGGSYTQIEGFRQWSRMKNTVLNGKWTYRYQKSSFLRIIANYANSPLAEDPGALPLDAALGNRRQAWIGNTTYQTNEQIEQGKLGLIWHQNLTQRQQLHGFAFISQRNFQNTLPFENGGWVSFDRLFGGAGLSYRFNRRFGDLGYRLSSGLDWDFQHDDRSRFNNVLGVKGSLALHQKEQFASLGWFLIQQINWRDWLTFSLGVRQDNVYIQLEDRFLQDGDDSGDSRQEGFNPSIGLNVKLDPFLYIFANYSTSFETPTLSELSANPLNTGGFNPALQPLRAKSLEIGLKGRNDDFNYGISVFHIPVEDEIIPFELENFPGRTFFQNAGKTVRNGLELEGNYRFSKHLEMGFNYTWSDFQFKGFRDGNVVLDGEKLPGIPSHRFFTEWRIPFRENGLQAAINWHYIGNLYADNANTTQVDAYSTLNLRFGYAWQKSHWRIAPFAGIQNLLNQDYFSNIRINAFGGRYFEPASGIQFYVGISTSFAK